MADLITLAFKAIELAKKLKAMVDQKAAADEGAAALHLAIDGLVPVVELLTSDRIPANKAHLLSKALSTCVTCLRDCSDAVKSWMDATADVSVVAHLNVKGKSIAQSAVGAAMAGFNAGRMYHSAEAKIKQLETWRGQLAYATSGLTAAMQACTIDLQLDSAERTPATICKHPRARKFWESHFHLARETPWSDFLEAFVDNIVDEAFHRTAGSSEDVEDEADGGRQRRVDPATAVLKMALDKDNSWTISVLEFAHFTNLLGLDAFTELIRLVTKRMVVRNDATKLDLAHPNTQPIIDLVPALAAKSCDTLSEAVIASGCEALASNWLATVGDLRTLTDSTWSMLLSSGRIPFGLGLLLRDAVYAIDKIEGCIPYDLALSSALDRVYCWHTVREFNQDSPVKARDYIARSMLLPRSMGPLLAKGGRRAARAGKAADTSRLLADMDRSMLRSLELLSSLGVPIGKQQQYTFELIDGGAITLLCDTVEAVVLDLRVIGKGPDGAAKGAVSKDTQAGKGAGSDKGERTTMLALLLAQACDALENVCRSMAFVPAISLPSAEEDGPMSKGPISTLLRAAVELSGSMSDNSVHSAAFGKLCQTAEELLSIPAVQACEVRMLARFLFVRGQAEPGAGGDDGLERVPYQWPMPPEELCLPLLVPSALELSHASEDADARHSRLGRLLTALRSDGSTITVPIGASMASVLVIPVSASAALRDTLKTGQRVATLSADSQYLFHSDRSPTAGVASKKDAASFRLLALVASAVQTLTLAARAKVDAIARADHAGDTSKFLRVHPQLYVLWDIRSSLRDWDHVVNMVYTGTPYFGSDFDEELRDWFERYPANVRGSDADGSDSESEHDDSDDSLDSSHRVADLEDDSDHKQQLSPPGLMTAGAGLQAQPTPATAATAAAVTTSASPRTGPTRMQRPRTGPTRSVRRSSLHLPDGAAWMSQTGTLDSSAATPQHATASSHSSSYPPPAGPAARVESTTSASADGGENAKPAGQGGLEDVEGGEEAGEEGGDGEPVGEVDSDDDSLYPDGIEDDESDLPVPRPTRSLLHTVDVDECCTNAGCFVETVVASCTPAMLRQPEMQPTLVTLARTLGPCLMYSTRMASVTPADMNAWMKVASILLRTGSPPVSQAVFRMVRMMFSAAFYFDGAGLAFREALVTTDTGRSLWTDVMVTVHALSLFGSPQSAAADSGSTAAALEAYFMLQALYLLEYGYRMKPVHSSDSDPQADAVSFDSDNSTAYVKTYIVDRECERALNGLLFSTVDEVLVGAHSATHSPLSSVHGSTEHTGLASFIRLLDMFVLHRDLSSLSQAYEILCFVLAWNESTDQVPGLISLIAQDTGLSMRLANCVFETSLWETEPLGAAAAFGVLNLIAQGDVWAQRTAGTLTHTPGVPQSYKMGMFRLLAGHGPLLTALLRLQTVSTFESDFVAAARGAQQLLMSLGPAINDTIPRIVAAMTDGKPKDDPFPLGPDAVLFVARRVDLADGETHVPYWLMTTGFFCDVCREAILGVHVRMSYKDFCAGCALWCDSMLPPTQRATMQGLGHAIAATTPKTFIEPYTKQVSAMLELWRLRAPHGKWMASGFQPFLVRVSSHDAPAAVSSSHSSTVHVVDDEAHKLWEGLRKRRMLRFAVAAGTAACSLPPTGSASLVDGPLGGSPVNATQHALAAVAEKLPGVHSTSSSPAKQGAMLKRRAGTFGWRQRIVLVRAGVLSYFQNAASCDLGRAKGELQLREWILLPDVTERAHAYSVDQKWKLALGAVTLGYARPPGPEAAHHFFGLWRKDGTQAALVFGVPAAETEAWIVVMAANGVTVDSSPELARGFAMREADRSTTGKHR